MEEREGAKHASHEIKCPVMPCRERLAANKARTFASASREKVTAFLQAVEKVLDFFDSLKGDSPWG